MNKNRRISIRAIPGLFNPKNKNDHKTFNTNWIQNQNKLPFLRHTIPKEIPIRRNNIVHTGPNNQLGGLKNGLLRYRYQELIEFMVAGVGMFPTNSQKRIEHIYVITGYFLNS